MSMRSIYTIILTYKYSYAVVLFINTYLHTREKTIGNNWPKGGLGSLWFTKTTSGA